ncbi:MAG: hypothetical protein BZ135_00485 [Methanosphaera sp. rholeuAM6]|nr:MAG: hypothetical protein BZ135_00485 [Methanosphaera sp. rholeuAM6]
MLEKAKRIDENIKNENIETIYSFKKLIEVLNEGLKKEYDNDEEYDLKQTTSIIKECYNDVK